MRHNRESGPAVPGMLPEWEKIHYQTYHIMDQERKYRALDNYLWSVYNRCNRFLKGASPEYRKNASFNFPYRDLMPGYEKYREFAGVASVSDRRIKNPSDPLFIGGFTDDQILERMSLVWDRWVSCHDIGQLRNGTTKDNNGKKIGSGNGRCSPYYRGNRVRVPSKKRKNRMKQFNKLFPGYLDFIKQ